jgi:hypothetical protein
VRTYVVFEARIGSQVVWGWGEVSAAGPGFENISYTEADGFSPADITAAPEFTKFLFTVTAGAVEQHVNLVGAGR